MCQSRTPPGTRFRRLRLILSLGRLINQNYATPRLGRCDLEQGPECRLGTNGPNGLLINSVQVDRIKHQLGSNFQCSAKVATSHSVVSSFSSSPAVDPWNYQSSDGILHRAPFPARVVIGGVGVD